MQPSFLLMVDARQAAHFFWRPLPWRGFLICPLSVLGYASMPMCREPPAPMQGRTDQHPVAGSVGQCHAHYDQPTGKIVIELNNGVGLHIPPTLIQGMESATPADMAEIVIEGHGIGLHFPRLDADLYVPALARGVLGTSAWMRNLGRKGGISKSPAKAEAARRNGRLGGRPPSTEKKAAS